MTRPEAPFDEPWQAQLFALTVALNEAGHVDWSDWVARFAPRIRDAPPEVYWQVWSDTLVDLLAARGLAGASEIASLTRRWQDAARTTPHGQPIDLPPAG